MFDSLSFLPALHTAHRHHHSSKVVIYSSWNTFDLYAVSLSPPTSSIYQYHLTYNSLTVITYHHIHQHQHPTTTNHGCIDSFSR